jgi:hypothetical protein
MSSWRGVVSLAQGQTYLLLFLKKADWKNEMGK